ncbi:MAG: RNA-binding domain-containing protein, partial [Ignavibacteriaceae bacterium]
FLNREGGSILLGVDDNGNVTGVEPSAVFQMCADISSLSNNPSKLDPTYLLLPSEVEIQNKKVIHIQVPASSQVHKCNDVVFDRSSDGDFRVTSPERIAEIYNRKRTHFTEGTIYSQVSTADFKPGLLSKARTMIASNNSYHPWLQLSDQDFFRTSGLYKRDFQTGHEGFTLSAVLLLGKDDVIKSILPPFKIDALLRKIDVNRYDDRLIIETNLIDAYDLLMEFVEKHLPDKFFLENDKRISLRTRIFREVIANMLVHREYTNAHAATFNIYADRVEVQNANNPNGSGPITVKNFVPFPKNPTISKFFVQLGRVEELGSGLININKYLKEYAPGSKPEFIEGNIFKTVIPTAIRITKKAEISTKLDVQVTNDPVYEALNEALNEALKQSDILARLNREMFEIYKKEGLSIPELMEIFELSRATAQRDIKILKDSNMVAFVGAKKTGKYLLTNKLLKKIKE